MCCRLRNVLDGDDVIDDRDNDYDIEDDIKNESDEAPNGLHELPRNVS